MKIATATATALLGAALFLSGACGKKPPPQAPPPPLRPVPEPAAKTGGTAPKDCELVTPSDEDPEIAFGQRSITESTRLSEQAKVNLKTAESAEIGRVQREDYITNAVRDLITALRSDPYNVGATYSLARTYARIGRPQCSMNLLVRLLQLRSRPSQRKDVEAHLDILLGRKQPLDPDFADMRRDDRFRELIKKMCEGTNDPNCVFGAGGR